jgi:hypothetical protein
VAIKLFGSATAINNYTLIADSSVVPYRYRVFIELQDEKLAEHCAELPDLLDKELQRVNLSYSTLARAQHRLDKPAVTLVAQGAFEKLEENHYRRKPGTSRNQVKVPHLLTNTEQIALLDQMAINSSDSVAKH